MLSSIRNFFKSIFAKIFVAIIALPFILWGAGDIFRSGNQNVLANINDEKISSQEFVKYLQKINLTQDEIKNVNKIDLLNDVLSRFISEKIILLERTNKKIQVNDNSLKEIIISDKEFSKDGNFSRTKYEKFLLQNGFSAPVYERNLKDIELKGQLLTYYSGGIRIPTYMINDLFIKENKIKDIEYINLNKLYSNKIITDEEIDKYYNENKNLFEEKFISFKYIELNPEILTQNKEYDEVFFKKLDEIENKILDGNNFQSIISEYQSFVKTIDLVNSRKINKDGNKITEIDENIFNKIFLINKKNSPEFINFENNYYLVELLDEKKIILTLKDKDLKKTIVSQLKIRSKLLENTKLSEKLKSTDFSFKDMNEISKKNNIPIEKAKINNMFDTNKFDNKFLEQIYNHKKNQIFLMYDTLLQNNYLVRILNEENPKINKNTNKYKDYKKKANINYINKVYRSYDKYINSKYKIDINEKVLERLANSF